MSAGTGAIIASLIGALGLIIAALITKGQFKGHSPKPFNGDSHAENCTLEDDFSEEDISDDEWKKIRDDKKERDDNGLVLLSNHVHSVYKSGHYLDSYLVEMTVYNPGKRPRKVAEFDLHPLAQKEVESVPFVGQIIPEERVEGDARLDGKPSKYVIPERHGVLKLKFRFKGKGLGAKKDCSFRFWVIPQYSEDSKLRALQEDLVTPDIHIFARYHATRKLIVSVHFAEDGLPVNVHREIREYGKEPVTPSEADIEANQDDSRYYEATYYAVHKQDFSYGMAWGWLKQRRKSK